MILYIEIPEDSIKKLLELVKLQDTKINTQKSLLFLSANNELSEREIKKTIPFKIALKRIKYLKIR